MAVREVTAEEEYACNPLLRKDDVAAVSTWLATQAHLPTIPETTVMLYLHACRYSLERTKSALEYNYTIRSHFPEMFSDRRPIGDAGLETNARIIYQTVLPQALEDGRRIFCGGFLQAEDVDSFSLDDTLKRLGMVFDLDLAEVGTRCPGYVILVDSRGVSMGHVLRLRLTTLRKIMTYVQDGIPLRILRIDVLNCLPIVDKVMSMLRPFLRPEFEALIRLHAGDAAPLAAIAEGGVSRGGVPRQLGGTLDVDLAQLSAATIARLQANVAFFEAEASMRVDESRRQGDRPRADLFGAEGSFKNLDID